MRGHYSADSPCPRHVVAAWVGPWPGIWWDHAVAFLSKQSAEFFGAFAAAGGEVRVNMIV